LLGSINAAGTLQKKPTDEISKSGSAGSRLDTQHRRRRERFSDREVRHFVSNARDSDFERDSVFEIATPASVGPRLGYISEEETGDSFFATPPVQAG